ncbi:MAG: hypothetical protein WC797_03955, partial [Candidatus Paceibacterota bacterium]
MKNITKENIRSLFFVLLVVFFINIIAIGALIGFASANRTKIFNYFAGGYITDQDNLRKMDKQEASDQQKVLKSLFTQETMIVDAVARANPAVVSIYISKDVPIMESFYSTEDPFGGLLGPNFKIQIPQLRQNGTERKQVGGGSGFI